MLEKTICLIFYLLMWFFFFLASIIYPGLKIICIPRLRNGFSCPLYSCFFALPAYPAGKDNSVVQRALASFHEAFSSFSVVNTVSFCSVSWHSFSFLTVPLIGCSYHEHSSVSAMWENLCRGPTSTDLYLPWCSQCSVYSPSHARLLSHTGKSSRCFRAPRTIEASIVVPHPRFPVVTL